MEHLYERFEEDSETHDYYIELSFCELYNEQIRDLLNTDKPPTGGLRLLENEKDRVAIHQIVLKRPKTVAEVMELVQIGNARRSTSFTHANSQSSRSHAILQINVGKVGKGTEVDMAKQVVRQCVTSATLSIIDLAGSERAAASQNFGDRRTEGKNINKSLLALSSCITALCTRPMLGQKIHVPYRNSNLTRLLKFSLGGNCRTVMIVCVSPSSKDIDDTHNTLQWANRAKDVSTKISRNTEGVALRTQQYLDKIAFQEQRIEELEAERTAGPKNVENPALIAKRERDRQEMQQALDGLDAEVETHEATIDAGAEKRALWDVSELTTGTLRRRIRDLQSEIEARSALLVKRDLQYLESRIKEEDAKFRNNRIVWGLVQKEKKSTSTIENHIENISGRSFDNLPEGDSERLKLALKHKREQVDNKVFAARERGYRRMIVEHINKDATASLHIYSQKESLVALAEAMLAAGGTASQFARQLQDEITRSETAMDILHGHLAPITEALPPPVRFDNLQDFGLTLPPPTPMGKPSKPPVFTTSPMPAAPVFALVQNISTLPAIDKARPPRSRLSLLPRASPPSSSSSSSSRSRLSLVPGSSLPQASSSPLGKPILLDTSDSLPKHQSISRVQNSGKPSSPRKRLSASPAKRRFAPPIKSALASVGQPRIGPAKTARWRGDDSITEEKTISDTQTMSSPEWMAGSGNDSGSSEWDDVDDEDDKPKLSVPAPVLQPVQRMGPPRRMSLAPIGTKKPSPLGASSSSLASAMPPPPVQQPVAGPSSQRNDWKASRQRTVQTITSLNSVSEEGASMSSPIAGNTSRLGTTGLPTLNLRSSPLAESRQNPILPSASTSSLSRLLKPTASSSARTSGMGMGDMSIISVADTARLSRRESGIGPQSSRQNKRRSIAPAPYDRKVDNSSPSSVSSTEGTPFDQPNISQNKASSALAGGARRASVNPFRMGMGMGTGDSSMSMRSGPRESISTSASLRPTQSTGTTGDQLKSRPSMANMSSFRQQSGETSMLMPRASVSNLRQSVAGNAEPPKWR